MKLFTKAIALSLMIALGLNASAQGLKQCGAHHATNELLMNHPEFKSEIDRLDSEAHRKAKDINKEKNNQKYIIPVVFHIIHNYGQENISDAQVRDALRIVNEDFNKKNADTTAILPIFQSIVGNANIEFRLANLDPQGNCTNGIDRIASPKTYQAGDGSKLNPWPRERYLNIWVTNSIGSQGVAGYAYKPSGAAQGMMFLVDGILILHDYVGSIGTGSISGSRALTHEIGHYLGLDHPWGPTNNPDVDCGDDGVDDTPITEGSTSCNLNLSECSPPIIENVQNFMDYSFCCKMFTAGQCALMRITMENSVADRNLLSTPANLAFTGTADPYVTSVCQPIADFSANRFISCVGEQVTFSDESWNANVTGWSWTFSNATPSSSTAQNPQVVFNSTGWQTVTLTASNSTGSDNESRTSYIYVGNPYAELIAPYTEDFSLEQNFNWYWKSNNLGKDNKEWKYMGNYGRTSSNGCVMLNTFNSSSGESDELISPAFNLNFITVPKLEFYYSSGSVTTTPAEMLDRLLVYTSTDCGRTWTQRLQLTGTAVSNGGYFTGQYYPGSNANWTKATANLSNSSIGPNVRFKFAFISGGTSNNIFIDDINIFGATGETSLLENNLSNGNFTIQPNPTSQNAEVRFELENNDQVSIELMDILGKKIASIYDGKLTVGQHNFTINENLITNAGLYFVRIQSSAGTTTKRLVVNE
jgi:PKD repeat protein